MDNNVETDKRISDIDKKSDELVDRIHDLHLDLRVIGDKCEIFTTTLSQINRTLYGNSNEGVLVRLKALESDVLYRSKLSWIVLGSLITASLSLAVSLITKFF